MQPDRRTEEFLDDILRGKLDRRAALRRAAGLGLTASALATMVASRAAAVGAQDASPSPVASPGASPVASPAPGGGYQAQGPAVENLVFWTRSSTDTSPNEWNALVAASQAYTAAVGTPVELVTVPDPDFRSRLSLAAPSGEGPDVLGPIAHDWIGELAVQRIAQAWTQDTISGFADLSGPSVQGVTVDGQIYGVPVFSEALALVYNADMVPEPPTTWQDLVTMAGEMTSGDVYGFAFPILTQYYQGPFFYGFDSFVFAYENGAFDIANIGLNNAGGVETARFLRDMYHTQQPAMPEAVLDSTNAGGFIDGLMESQQLAMTIAGPWREPPLTDAGINYSVVTLPTLPNGNPMIPFVGFQALVVNAYGQQLEAATDFVNYLASTEGVNLMIEGFNKAPVRTSAADTAVALNPNFEQWVAQADVGVPMPNIPAMNEVWTPWGDAMIAIVTENASDEDVQMLMDQAVEQIGANIQQAQS